ncbi:MAG: response regulator [Candidatus Omnitrophota bacterium]
MTKKKILLIDDDALTLMITRDSLQDADYEVVIAKDGKEGIAKLKSENVDLVILDLILPDIDGFAFLDTCKGDPQTKDVPVIAFTGRDSSEDIDKLKSRGALACLVKHKTPPGHLENIIRMIFEQQ